VHHTTRGMVVIKDDKDVGPVPDDVVSVFQFGSPQSLIEVTRNKMLDTSLIGIGDIFGIRFGVYLGV